MNVIDGQAGLISYTSLIFYSLTIDNILNIIVLLILAAVSIATLTGENGILTQVSKVKEENRGASVEEAKDLWKINQKSDNYAESTTAQTLEELINDLVNQKLLTEDEKDQILGNDSKGIEATYQVTIGSRTIIFETKWRETEEGISNGEITVQVGDYVNYDHTSGTTKSVVSTSKDNGYADQTFNLTSYTGGWRVLGVENGELLLISEVIVGPDSGGYTNETTGVTEYYLYGQRGYQNGITELDKISSMYGQGTYATGVRSITVDDINKITGYNPNNVGVKDVKQVGIGTKYGSGSLDEYGNKVTYYWQGTNYPYYTATNGLKGSLTDSHSHWFFWCNNTWKASAKSSTATTSNMEEITSLTSNYYTYCPNTLTESSVSTATTGISRSSKEYNLLFANTSTGKYYDYWLGSQYVQTTTSCVYFSLRHVDSGLVRGVFGIEWSGGYSFNFSHGIRPVVSLKSEIRITGGSGTKDSPYILGV